MINYYLLTKPGIIMGNIFTVFAGFVLASKGNIDFRLFLTTLIGLALVIASACVFNNTIDRQLDRKMERTKNRALAVGSISVKKAIFFAISLGVSGGMILFFYTNPLTFLMACLGFFIYVILYSLWKPRTIYATAIGSVAGAIPPIVGYTAFSNQLDSGALILFSMLILWQMPHFYAIAMAHLEEYKAASIPVLPVIKGAQKTKRRMLLYILSFLPISMMLTLFHYTGYFYLISTLSLGLIWFIVCMSGFRVRNDTLWAKKMFYCSLAALIAACLSISLNVVK